MRIHRTFGVLSLLLVTALVACTPSTPAPAPTATPNPNFKLGIIYNAKGSRLDGTFNEYAYVGTQLASKTFNVAMLPDRTTVEDKEYPGALEKIVADGANIVVTVGFQMQDDTVAAAKKYPKVYFLGVDQAPDSPPSNYAGIIFREDQGGFLAGAVAGMMTKSGTVAVLGGKAFPPVQRYVNGFLNGVHYVNAKANALSIYMDTFDDANKGRSTADDMLSKGADVLFNAAGLAGSVGIARGAEQGKFVIGVDQDEFRTTFATGQNADKILTSAVKRVDTGVFTAISSIINGKFKGGLLQLSAADCGITYAPFHNADSAIPATVKTRLEAIWRALAGNTLQTGADVDKAATPEPLADGASPKIADNAPKLSDCNKS